MEFKMSTLAVTANDVAKAKNLLNAGNVDVNETICDDWSRLQYAVSEKNADMVKLLIDNGANVRVKSRSGRTLLHSVIITGNLDILDLLLPLVDVNESTHVGSTPLHFAVIYSKYHIARRLLAYNANVNARNAKGSTPLHLALHHFHYDMAELLLRSGADSTIRNNEGDVAYKDFNFQCNKSIGFALLQRAIDADITPDLANLSEWEKVFFTVIDSASNAEIEKCLKLCGSKLSLRVKNAALNSLLDKPHIFPIIYLLIKFGAHVSDIEFLKGYKMAIVVKSVACLLEQGLDVHEENIHQINSIKWISKYYTDYCNELQIMKKTAICNDFCTTYFDICTADTHKLTKMLRSADIRSELKTEKYKKMFFFFPEIIESNCERVLKNANKVDEFCEIVSDALNVVNIPSEIAFKIVGYMSTEDLESCFKVKCRVNV